MGLSSSQVFVCPKCNSHLEELNNISESQIKCEKCHIHYPVLQGIPWLFLNSNSMWKQWSGRCRSLVDYLDIEQKVLSNELRKVDLLPSTRARLNLKISAAKHNQEQMAQILSPFLGSHQVGGDHGSSNLFSDRIPGRQGLLTYLDLIFRDWSWENSEISESMQIIESIIPHQNIDWKELIVLGGGAGRLPLEIALLHPNMKVFSVDFNPLLGLFAQAMFNNESWEIFEQPVSPLSLEETCVRRELRNPKNKVQNLSLVFADGLNLPVASESLSAILTPWFIDVVPIDLKLLCRKINCSLKRGGEWVNFGPLGFSYSSSSAHYSPQELKEILDMTGFKIEVFQQTDIPYLQSPHSGHWRREKVWAFRAKKVKTAKNPGRYQYLPDWLLNLDLPIPQEKFLSEISTQSRFQFEVLTAVDGQRSINILSQLMAAHYGMSQKMAEEALLTFLIRSYENSI